MNSVRRTLAIAGLLALGLIGYQLMLGQITMVAAAQRATAVMVALMLLQWLVRLTVSFAISRLEAGPQTGLQQVDLHRADGSGS